jgi:hypothetical protein
MASLLGLNPFQQISAAEYYARMQHEQMQRQMSAQGYYGQGAGTAADVMRNAVAVSKEPEPTNTLLLLED